MFARSRTIGTQVTARKNVLCQRCKKKMKVKRSKSLSPEPSSSENSKRAKIEDDSKSGAAGEPNLLNFSDDVLLMIMKYLDSFDMMNLSMCCQRLDQVTRDRTLWSVMDCRARAMSVAELKKFTKFFQPSVKTFAIRGNSESNNYSEFNKNFLKTIMETCTQLKELVIQEFYINGTEIQISDFPSSLEKLSLKGCDVFNMEQKKSYFFQVQEHMPNLTCLILSHCTWFSSHSLMVISKLPKLKELRLDSCHSLGECLAYVSLAVRYGYKSLEILDLRNTVIGDSEISCFSSMETLTHLYLECPPTLRISEMNNINVQRADVNHREAERPLVRAQILGHPVNEDRNVPQVQVVRAEDFDFHDMERYLITDRAICSLGSYVCKRRIVDNNRGGIIRIEEDSRIFNNPNLKTLVVRHFPQVTDRSLHHLAVSKLNLDFVDVTGSAVTREGVQLFRMQKPEVKIVSSFDDS